MITSPPELFRKARSLGLHVIADGQDLLVSPRVKCPPEFVAELQENKAELVDWLTGSRCPGWLSIPPNDLPLATEMPRPTPANRERMIGYLVRQGCDRPSPLTAWLVKRECSYYDGPGRHWDCAVFAYAAARDAACWQLNRTERAVLDLIAGCESSAETFPPHE
ncbi:MAG TPA: hypothetical protein VNT99_17930 [Methylomirabilota bacterium]|nr:hypothetical protein [Methylomirabilota bacterium]